MSRVNVLNREIIHCQIGLQQTRLERQFQQSLLWQRVEAPLLLGCGLGIGMTVYRAWQGDLADNAQGWPAQWSWWLWRLFF